MIAAKKIDEIAEEVAGEELRAANVKSVTSDSATDSEGRDAVRITIVLRPGAAETIDGDAALDTLVKIQQKLQEAGEQRRAIVEYATEEELAEGGDT
jgi:hypothetical protein